MPKVRQRVLSATLLQPQRRWYASELARHLGVRPSTLQRELAALSDAGILQRTHQGRTTFYQADPDCPLLSDLQAILSKTVGLADVLSEALRPLASLIRVAFVHGSVAAGGAKSTSDIDLIIIGSVRLASLASTLRPVHAQLGRQINVKLYSASEFAARVNRRDGFLPAVRRKPLMFILGDEHDLEQTAGGEAGRR